MVNVIILGLASFLTDVSSEMVYPLLPLFLTSALGATPAIVGVIEGLAESAASLVRVFSGYFSDRLGQRKSLAIGGYSLSAVGKVILYLANTWPLVLVSRLT
ncbi:MAG: MFS transporter, partial [Rudaea sp.]